MTLSISHLLLLFSLLPLAVQLLSPISVYITCIHAFFSQLSYPVTYRLVKTNDGSPLFNSLPQL